jgi:hypothetical protein
MIYGFTANWRCSAENLDNMTPLRIPGDRDRGFRIGVTADSDFA